MLSLRHARRYAHKSLRATPTPSAKKLRLVKPVLFLAGISSTVAVYLLLPDKSRATPTYASKTLSPSYFTPATLVKSTETSADTKLLTLSVPPELLPHDHPDKLTPIWSVFIKDDDIQVERPYTPLEGVGGDGKMTFWIKKYEYGEVGRWLHSKQPGESIEIRGPVTTWLRSWMVGDWDEIIMISGGTGITPFYQLLHGIFANNDTPFRGRLTLLHSSRSKADGPPPMMMNFLTTTAQKHPDKFKLQLFVDSLIGGVVGECSATLKLGRIGKADIQNALELPSDPPWWRRLFPWSTAAVNSPERKIMIMVCGPEQMVKTIAGPYGRNYSQGQVGGILEELGFNSRQVWKL
ncbi:hypothetical protein F5I97DRAFT_1804980 [Phlebopus sp. FC_14]|nr:hypothetical protein F5I97DRAFT_1804980 [Phlebopus sp. FC_14]